VTADAARAALAAQGWAVVDLPDPAPVGRVRALLLAALQRDLPGLRRLDDYHRFVADDERHLAVLYDAATAYWESGLGRAIVAANLDLFHALLGPDLHVQRRPYLRCVRPGHPQDAAPLHRDTHYGAGVAELSVVVPLTEMDGACALRAVPGSHREPEWAYPFVQSQAGRGPIGSRWHRLGYPYAPRLLDPAVEARSEPVPVAVGQALIFGLSLVHGGGVSSGDRTRFSTDVRVVDSFAPVSHSRGVDPHYYVPLCSAAEAAPVS